MNRYLFIAIYIIIISAIVSLFYFNFNPIGNNTIYIFLLLGLIIVVNGIRRITLGLPFMTKYAFFSKERYLEIFFMFKKDN